MFAGLEMMPAIEAKRLITAALIGVGSGGRCTTKADPLPEQLAAWWNEWRNLPKRPRGPGKRPKLRAGRERA